MRPAGFHTASWNATDASGRGVASGVYLYLLLGGGVRLTRSMVLLDGRVVPGGGGSGAGGPTPGGTVGGTFGDTAGPGGGTGTEGKSGFPAAGTVSVSPVGAGFAGPADPSRRTAGAGDSEGRVFGLTITGAELVPWVDPAFRPEGGLGEIRVRPLSSLPRGKVASGGLLGDVNGDGQVDHADALLISSYNADPTLSLGNGGHLPRQCQWRRAGRSDRRPAHRGLPCRPVGRVAAGRNRGPSGRGGYDLALLDGRGRRPHSAGSPRRLSSGGCDRQRPGQPARLGRGRGGRQALLD